MAADLGEEKIRLSALDFKLSMGDATIDDIFEANGLREKVATDLKALKNKHELMESYLSKQYVQRDNRGSRHDRNSQNRQR
jgi:hypothetical protein